jgi:Flp pilus assembly pilin Flp
MEEMKKNLFRDEQGQAIVEYILMLAMVISVVAIIATSFRKSIRLIWLQLTKEIAAGCPDCAPPAAQ